MGYFTSPSQGDPRFTSPGPAAHELVPPVEPREWSKTPKQGSTWASSPEGCRNAWKNWKVREGNMANLYIFCKGVATDLPYIMAHIFHQAKLKHYDQAWHGAGDEKLVKQDRKTRCLRSKGTFGTTKHRCMSTKCYWRWFDWREKGQEHLIWHHHLHTKGLPKHKEVMTQSSQPSDQGVVNVMYNICFHRPRWKSMCFI